MTTPAILFLALSSVVGATPCFTPNDQTPGWKVVHLPENAPFLAAPEGVPQFRSGERAVVTYVDQEVPFTISDDGPGRARYDFALPQGARHAQVEFLEDLHGAKVDVTLWAGGRTLPLVRERRVRGRKVSLDWEFEQGSTLSIVVHHHLRPEPVVARWNVVSEIDPTELRDLPAAFREARVLYYLQSAGRVIQLCNAPDRRLAVSHSDLRGSASRTSAHLNTR